MVYAVVVAVIIVIAALGYAAYRIHKAREINEAVDKLVLDFDPTGAGRENDGDIIDDLLKADFSQLKDGEEMEI